MTQEEKQLLFIDLCGRLSYGVMVSVQGGEFDSYKYPYQLTAVSKFGLDCLCKVYHPIYTPFGVPKVEDVKPYLRPMSSMTEEEGKELEDLFSEIDAPCWVDTEYGCVNFAGGNDFIDTEMAEVYTDWLNKNMFDYRGLIEKGLALEAPEDMYGKI